LEGRRRASGALKAVALWLVAVAALTTLWLLWVGPSKSTGASIADVTYQPLTFEEGFVFAARFARDGRQVIYSADWESQPRDIFETSLDNQGVRALGYRGADPLAVAPDGALAILLDGIIPTGNPYHRRGTIARAALTGAAPR